ncbi:hypothetical protein LSH36_50g07041 [Paralvinella palmiformis]|uniref:Sulfotransferase domain-containing protein n=1 Tax=Paralvinella palmiformis TaxID=53620 RepID=A0AAD9K6S9_9ANNE|nr:hypothetical protein LSH36_50g07041 [Paralvinella palmiformis]
MTTEREVRPRKCKKRAEDQYVEEMIRSYQASIPSYVIYDGIPFPGSLLTKRIADIKNFRIRSDDVIICGYPRSGNHWMKEIVTLLYADDVITMKETQHISERIPLLELSVDMNQCIQTYMDNYFRSCGPFRPLLSKMATKFGIISHVKASSDTLVDPLAELEHRSSPRLMHTHLTHRMLPEGAKQGRCKIIYLIRNGKDVAVSFYEMHKMYPPFGYYSGEWKQFFHTYLSGKVCYGSWFNHVKDWYSHRETTNVLFVKYEDMIEDLYREVMRVAQFLSKDVTADNIRDVADKCTFKRMQENPMATYDGLHESIDTKKTSFLRRGKVGDWKSRLTVEQNEMFDDLFTKVFRDTDPQIRFQLNVTGQGSIYRYVFLRQDKDRLPDVYSDRFYPLYEGASVV